MIRIQRTRKAGWRMPPNTVSVTRPGPWGNPFIVGWYYVNLSGNWFVFPPNERPFGGKLVEDLPHSLKLFEKYARQRARRESQWLEPLIGKDAVACWCAIDAPCHAQLYLTLVPKRNSK